MANNMNGCCARLKAAFPRKQLALVGAHKLIHEIFKTPLFTIIPGVASGVNRTPLRVAPYSLQRLVLHEEIITNALDKTACEDVDDLGIPLSISRSLSPTVSLSIDTSLDEDLLDDESISSSFTANTSLTSACTTDTDSPRILSLDDARDSRSQDSEYTGLVITTMKLTDLHSSETRVVLPDSPCGNSVLLRKPVIPAVSRPELDTYNYDIVTVTALPEPVAGVRVCIPSAVSNSSGHVPNLVPGPIYKSASSSHSRSYGSQTLSELPAACGVAEITQQLPASLRRVTRTHDPPVHITTTLRQLDLNRLEVKSNHHNGTLCATSFCACPSPEKPELDMFWSRPRDERRDSPLNLHAMSQIDITPSYTPPHAGNEALDSIAPPVSQAAALLAILNTSLASHSSRPQLTNGGISCSGDPPVVKLAPIGHPTARSPQSSYSWRRSGSSCGTSPSSSPLSSPRPNANMCDEVLPWPPVLSEH